MLHTDITHAFKYTVRSGHDEAELRQALLNRQGDTMREAERQRGRKAERQRPCSVAFAANDFITASVCGPGYTYLLAQHTRDGYTWISTYKYCVQMLHTNAAYKCYIYAVRSGHATIG